MTRILPLAVVGAALALAGCGGSSGSSSSSSADFTSQANAICASSGAQIVALPAPDNTASGQAASIQAQLPIEQAEVAKLKTLTPPSSQEATWKSTLAAEEAIIALTPQVVTALNANDTATLTSLEAKAKPLTTTGQAGAKTLGLDKCAADYEPGGSSSSTSTAGSSS
jgi:hypothetical protein